MFSPSHFPPDGTQENSSATDAATARLLKSELNNLCNEIMESLNTVRLQNNERLANPIDAEQQWLNIGDQIDEYAKLYRPADVLRAHAVLTALLDRCADPIGYDDEDFSHYSNCLDWLQDHRQFREEFSELSSESFDREADSRAPTCTGCDVAAHSLQA